ncbi:hypothetical protein C8F01DRAFT_1121405 [Mycena amicta]|nr:hypothetical protein C8F01DRAFT_1121405 [Mycena amicta]
MPWSQLISKFAHAATDARTQDTNKLRSFTDKLLAPTLAHILYPPLSGDSKADRGTSHPVLCLELMGCKDRDHFPPPAYAKPNPANGNTLQLANLTDAELTPRAVELNAKLNAGTYVFKTSVFPSCFYEDGSYTRGEPQNGLFLGLVFTRACCFLFTGQSSTFTGFKGALPDSRSAVRLCNIWKMTPRMVGYVACQVRTMLSKADWGPKDGDYDYVKFFKRVVALFEDPTLEDWSQETLAFLQNEVYRDATEPATSVDNADDDKDNDDEFAAQRRALLAAQQDLITDGD